MARVSLILPSTPGLRPGPETIQPRRQALERAGHVVEVVVVVSSTTFLTRDEPASRTVVTDEPGMAAAAVAGLRAARGEVLLILDPTSGYSPEDLVRVVEPLTLGLADVSVANRRGSGWGALSARALGLLRPLTGTADPTSGLIGLTRDALDEVRDAFRPVGGSFVFELLSQVGGRWIDVPVATITAISRRKAWNIDDFRQLKRLADHRFGEYSRLIQFCAVGASGMVVDLTFYATFQWVFGRTWLAGRTAPLIGGSLDLALAGALAIGLALTWNFALNRRLTFSYARTGSLVRQFLTYALSNAVGVSLSLALRLLLPRYVPFFDAHRLAAAVVGIVMATGISFSMSRWLVFRRRSVTHARVPAPGEEALAQAIP